MNLEKIGVESWNVYDQDARASLRGNIITKFVKN